MLFLGVSCPKEEVMKRALIGGLSALAMIVGVEAANAQANINPNVYPNNTSERYGAQAPWEWPASVGPVRRGGQCVVDVDINRGYGFMKDCPAPQGRAAAAPRRPRTAHRYHRKSSS
jgi:hypothetical protein